MPSMNGGPTIILENSLENNVFLWLWQFLNREVIGQRKIVRQWKWGKRMTRHVWIWWQFDDVLHHNWDCVGTGSFGASWRSVWELEQRENGKNERKWRNGTIKRVFGEWASRWTIDGRDRIRATELLRLEMLFGKLYLKSNKNVFFVDGIEKERIILLLMHFLWFANCINDR